MLSFFERDGERLQCEIRPSSHAAGFDLEVTMPDGQKRLDHADDANILALRWVWRGMREWSPDAQLAMLKWLNDVTNEHSNPTTEIELWPKRQRCKIR